MKPARVRLACAAGMLLAAAAAAVGVRAWLADRALSDGRARQAGGDFLGAIERYEQAVRLGVPEAAAELAALALARRRWDEAAVWARRSLEEAPTAPRPHVILAVAALRRDGAWDADREAEVLGACRAAAELAPMFSWVARDCGAAALDLAATRAGQWPAERRDEVVDEALSRYERAVALAPRAAAATVRSALDHGASPLFAVRAAAAGEGRLPLAAAVGLLVERGVWDAVAGDYRSAAEAAGDVARRGVAAAEALRAARRPEEAEAQARRVLESFPGDAEAWYQLGLALRSARRSLEAQEAFARAADLDPASPAYRRASGR